MYSYFHVWIKTACPLCMQSEELHKSIPEKLYKIFDRVWRIISGYHAGVRWWTHNRKSTHYLFKSEANYSHSKRYLLNELCVGFCWISIARKQASCTAYMQRAGKFQCMLYNIDQCAVTGNNFQINFYNHNLVMSSFLCPLLSETD